MLNLVFLFLAGTSLEDVFWEEFQMMMEQNGLPNYLQEALEHATFEQVDLDNDGVLSPEELLPFASKISHDITEVVAPNQDLTKEDFINKMKYPVFTITDDMAPSEMDAICQISYLFDSVSVDEIWNVIAEGSSVATLESTQVESFLSKTLMESNTIDFNTWKQDAESQLLPGMTFSDEPVIPEQCVAVRRRMFMQAIVAEMAIMAGSLLAAATQSLVYDCQKDNKHWQLDFNAEDCNKVMFQKHVVADWVIANGVVALTLITPEFAPAAAARVAPIEAEEAGALLNGARAAATVGVQLAEAEGGSGFGAAVAEAAVRAETLGASYIPDPNAVTVVMTPRNLRGNRFPCTGLSKRSLCLAFSSECRWRRNRCRNRN